MSLNSSTFPLVFGLLVLIFGLCLACIRLRRLSSDHPTTSFNATPPTASVQLTAVDQRRGLDETTLNTYPKMLYSDILLRKRDMDGNNKKKKGDGVISSDDGGGNSSFSSSCSICLGDYKESDMLRLLPDCGHLYHVSCVDQWLKLHTTCPICRTSSSSLKSMEDHIHTRIEIQ